ncbi:helix-turn-helix transcriptional regulator [Asticcacaulis solisilvae]|nr:helix-turn-helix transcriptional regulator [Asticcacaulis solisilvae]
MDISSAQCRAARALVNMKQQDLADASRVSKRTIVNFELDAAKPVPSTLDALRRALETAGVEFIPENGGGVGVRLKSPG